MASMTTFNHPTASDYFGSIAASYDSLIRRAVPRYAEMADRLMDYLPGQARDVLELGCGTGNLSSRLAERYPEASLAFVDAAPAMIEVTRSRVGAEHPRPAAGARFVTARFEELSLDPESFDVVTSCISLHHVRDKLPLYRLIHRALRPGGTFRFADQL